jgi:hypothetical protein
MDGYRRNVYLQMLRQESNDPTAAFVHVIWTLLATDTEPVPHAPLTPLDAQNHRHFKPDLSRGIKMDANRTWLREHGHVEFPVDTHRARTGARMRLQPRMSCDGTHDL